MRGELNAPAPCARRPGAALLGGALLALWLAGLSATACRQRAPGTCAEDIDCAAGNDCKAGLCVRRERLRWGGEGTPVPAKETATTTTGTASTPQPADAATTDRPDGAVDRPARRPAAPAPPSQAAPPSPPTPAGREPLWKQRLKNGRSRPPSHPASHHFFHRSWSSGNVRP